MERKLQELGGNERVAMELELYDAFSARGIPSREVVELECRIAVIEQEVAEVCMFFLRGCC